MTIESERFWVLALALVTFLAGGAAGLLVAGRVTPPPSDPVPFAGYEQLFASAFDLSPEKRRELRWALTRYERDIEDLKARHLNELEPELIRIGGICRDRIREYILTTQEQRERFDRLASGVRVSTPATRLDTARAN